MAVGDVSGAGEMGGRVLALLPVGAGAGQAEGLWGAEVLAP